jgi:outer membrane protein OmpU
MKHMLLATTALVATAGIASADLSISGSAEIGIAEDATGNTEYFQDIEVTFSGSGETSGGLSFGMSVQLDEDGSAPATHGGTTINVSGGFGNITMGDTDGASDWAVTETAVGGSMADDHTAHAGYSGNSELDGREDGQVLRWDYTAGAMGIAASLEQANDGAASTEDDTVQVGIRYGMDMGGSTVNLGVGFADAGNQIASAANAAGHGGITAADAGDSDGVSLSVSMTTVGGLTATLNSTDGSIYGHDSTHMGIGFGMTMDALTVGINYGELEVNNVTETGVGLAVNYSLGDSATFQLGYGDGEGVDTMSVGLALSF